LQNRLEQAKGASGTVQSESPHITRKGVLSNVQGHLVVHLLAKDLPHSLKRKDSTNATAASMYNILQSCLIFKSRVKEGDVDAPPIIIYDSDDGNDDAINTHLNFYYTDQVWHGEGVPVSDIKLLEGCNCEGVSDPNSKEC
jgi:hypothetical protein